MTLIKSILMGSAAGIVAVASAQAADLPTRKAAPVEYVKVCNVGGITGWTLPGSDTCVKFSGYITAQFEGGNLNTQYNFGSINNAIGADYGGLSPIYPVATTGFAQATQRVLIAASAAQNNTTFYRNQAGWTTRANFGFDMASNTAYGPLIGPFRHQLRDGQRVRQRRHHLPQHGRDRMRAKLKDIKAELRRRVASTYASQGRWLRADRDRALCLLRSPIQTAGRSLRSGTT